MMTDNTTTGADDAGVEPLPCPFCGGRTNIVYDGDPKWPWVGIVDHARDCVTLGYGYETKAEAVAAWNTRAALARLPTTDVEAENARLREALEWYAIQGANCRKVTSEGREACNNLDDDGGKRARAALGQPA